MKSQKPLTVFTPTTEDYCAAKQENSKLKLQNIYKPLRVHIWSV